MSASSIHPSSSRLRPAILIILAVCLASTLLSGEAAAVKPVERHSWVAGLAYGVGRGDVELNNPAYETDWARGASPQYRLGKMIGNHFSIGIEDRQFLDEGGISDLKVRANIQNFALVLTAYPGRTSNLTSGFFLQVGYGVAHARISALEPYEGGANEWGETYEVVYKRDDSGTAYLIGAGYEFHISSHFAVGVSATYNSLDFDDGVFDSATFIPGGLNLNWYF